MYINDTKDMEVCQNCLPEFRVWKSRLHRVNQGGLRNTISTKIYVFIINFRNILLVKTLTIINND